MYLHTYSCQGKELPIKISKCNDIGRQFISSLRNSSLTVKNFPNRNLNQKLYPFCMYFVSQPNFIIQIFSEAKATPPAEKKHPKLDSQQVTSWFKIIQLTPSSITVRKV